MSYQNGKKGVASPGVFSFIIFKKNIILEKAKMAMREFECFLAAPRGRPLLAATGGSQRWKRSVFCASGNTAGTCLRSLHFSPLQHSARPGNVCMSHSWRGQSARLRGWNGAPAVGAQPPAPRSSPPEPRALPALGSAPHSHPVWRDTAAAKRGALRVS